jgi:hypothetical protein
MRETIRAALDEASAWLEIDGVESVGRGEEDGRAVIVVGVSVPEASIRARLPRTLHGHPVVLRFTGVVSADRAAAPALRVWLHEGHDAEPGCEAWALDVLGFATWARSSEEVLAKLAGKLAEHARWCARHGLPPPAPADGIEVVARATGNEILFAPDREPAAPGEIEHATRLLAASRRDLLATLEDAPDALLDWDPPYRRFASWADWRTIRATLAHVANGETHYYTRAIGFTCASPPATPHDDWRTYLPRSRAEAVAFLHGVASSTDRARVATLDLGAGEERWSVRKALRRLVRHEILHGRSIRRIAAAWRATS